MPLVPGATSESFVRTSLLMASALKGKLTFLYVISPSQYASYAGTGAVMATSAIHNLKEQKDHIQQHYTHMLEANKDIISPHVVLERIVIESPWVSGILEYADKYRPGMVFLKHEEHSLIEKVLGDANTELINGLSAPVWVIPEKAEEALPGKVAYLTDHRKKDIDALKHLSMICKQFKAKIHIVHIGEDDFESEIKRMGFESLLEKELDDCKFSHQSIKREHLTENVRSLIGEKGYDLLVMLNESENFISRFFSRSSVEKIMSSVEIPLAIYS